MKYVYQVFTLMMPDKTGLYVPANTKNSDLRLIHSIPIWNIGVSAYLYIDCWDQIIQIIAQQNESLGKMLEIYSIHDPNQYAKESQAIISLTELQLMSNALSELAYKTKDNESFQLHTTYTTTPIDHLNSAGMCLAVANVFNEAINLGGFTFESYSFHTTSTDE